MNKKEFKNNKLKWNKIINSDNWKNPLKKDLEINEGI